MPQWLSVLIGSVAGLAVIAAAIFVAVRPYVSAKPPKPRMPDQTESRSGIDNFIGSGLGGGDGGGGF